MSSEKKLRPDDNNPFLALPNEIICYIFKFLCAPSTTIPRQYRLHFQNDLPDSAWQKLLPPPYQVLVKIKKNAGDKDTIDYALRLSTDQIAYGTLPATDFSMVNFDEIAELTGTEEKSFSLNENLRAFKALLLTKINHKGDALPTTDTPGWQDFLNFSSTCKDFRKLVAPDIYQFLPDIQEKINATNEESCKNLLEGTIGGTAATAATFGLNILAGFEIEEKGLTPMTGISLAITLLAFGLSLIFMYYKCVKAVCTPHSAYSPLFFERQDEPLSAEKEIFMAEKDETVEFIAKKSH